ncbi:hypothetical protein [Actinoplanes xinjiangensis]|uniref:Uncharacterized protein n=1 Tax=Actinoplanes xinjiangensis TaxID=512350 RepID=A0A316F443_9ACTN|nr:hypothetical protein [Actinoplanes xinjiangensis]PWK40219.1 hypothetical protein BC793_120158 [Actinoplanes xinjiangensis]GIF42535.1 hypothetical protein Axi01nite_68460 [Actinoplanes xinjiangensis]
MADLSTYLVPWKFARYAYRPRSADETKPFQRLSTARAYVGLVAIFVLSLPYLSGFDFTNDRINNSLIGFGATGVIAAVAAAVYAILGRPDTTSRAAVLPVMLRGLVPPLVITLIFLFAYYVEKNDVKGDAGSFLLVYPFILWGALIVLPLLFHGLRWTFGVSEVHPLLAPLASSLGAVAAYLLDGALPTADLRPEALKAFLKMGALVSVIVLSLIETVALTAGASRAKLTAVVAVVAAIATMIPFGLPLVRAQSTETRPQSTGLMYRDEDFKLELVQLRAVNGGIRADIDYQNRTNRTLELACPSKTGNSALVFENRVVLMTDGRCARVPRNTVVAVRAHQTFKTWGFFPVTAAKGESFKIRWWERGITKSSFAMPS